MTNETAKAVKKKGGLGPVLRGFRPAVPATVGTFALTLLFAAMMPMPWVGAICWHLYLDTIHPLFAPPLGNGARLGVALGLAIVAALVALVIALAMTKPAVKGNQAMNQRVARRARQAAADEQAEAEEVDSQMLRRRRIDTHPDAPPVAPIMAGRDLPAGGLDPATPPVVDYGLNSAAEGTPAETYGMSHGDHDADELLLEDGGDFLDLGFAEQLDSAEPAPFAAPAAAAPAASDNSLGAMVARFEAGLDRRRIRPGVTAAAHAVPAAAAADQSPPATPAPANEDNGPAVDLALEAALATLQRMSKSAVG